MRPESSSGIALSSKKSVHEAVLHSLNSFQPYYFVRHNDGEGVLTGHEDLPKEDVRLQLRRWFGSHDMPKRDVIGLNRLVISSYKLADCVGLPTPSMGPPFKRALEMFLRHVMPIRGSVAHVHTMMNLVEDRSFYDFITEAPKGVVLVSGVDVTEQFRRKFFRTRFKYVRTPIEDANFRQPGCKSTGHWQSRHAICDRLLEDLAPGTLVLVGAGILSKIYCQVAADAGAVALDVGSLFDAWAGKATRSYITPEYLL